MKFNKKAFNLKSHALISYKTTIASISTIAVLAFLLSIIKVLGPSGFSNQNESKSTAVLGEAIKSKDAGQIKAVFDASTLLGINQTVNSLAAGDKKALVEQLLQTNATGNLREKIVNALTNVLNNPNLGFYADILAYTKINIEGNGYFGSCNNIWLTPNIENDSGIQDVLTHELLHSFNCVNGGPKGALDEGSAIWIFQLAFPEKRTPDELKAGFADGTYGTAAYYKDIGVGDTRSIALTAFTNPNTKSQELFNWLSSGDPSKLKWNDPVLFQKCYEKYYMNLDRNVPIDQWSKNAAAASQNMASDPTCDGYTPPYEGVCAYADRSHMTAGTVNECTDNTFNGTTEMDNVYCRTKNNNDRQYYFAKCVKGTQTKEANLSGTVIVIPKGKTYAKIKVEFGNLNDTINDKKEFPADASNTYTYSFKVPTSGIYQISSGAFDSSGKLILDSRETCKNTGGKEPFDCKLSIEAGDQKKQDFTLTLDGTGTGPSTTIDSCHNENDRKNFLCGTASKAELGGQKCNYTDKSKAFDASCQATNKSTFCYECSVDSSGGIKNVCKENKEGKDQGDFEKYLEPRCGGEAYKYEKALKGEYKGPYSDVYKCSKGDATIEIPESDICTKAPWNLKTGAGTPTPTMSPLLLCPSDGNHACAQYSNCSDTASFPKAKTEGNAACTAANPVKPFCCTKSSSGATTTPTAGAGTVAPTTGSGAACSDKTKLENKCACNPTTDTCSAGLDCVTDWTGSLKHCVNYSSGKYCPAKTDTTPTEAACTGGGTTCQPGNPVETCSCPGTGYCGSAGGPAYTNWGCFTTSHDGTARCCPNDRRFACSDGTCKANLAACNVSIPTATPNPATTGCAPANPSAPTTGYECPATNYGGCAGALTCQKEPNSKTGCMCKGSGTSSPTATTAPTTAPTHAPTAPKCWTASTPTDLCYNTSGYQGSWQWQGDAADAANCNPADVNSHYYKCL